MKYLDAAYEQLLEESVQTIADLRLKLVKVEQELSKMRSERISTTPELEAFSDDITEDDWDWRYQCPHCLAPLDYEPTGRCGMPCI